jgi:hypothetical protein
MGGGAMAAKPGRTLKVGNHRERNAPAAAWELKIWDLKPFNARGFR